MSMRNSSNKPSQEWATPRWLFEWFDERFHFDLDVAASHDNYKCGRYFTALEDGLKMGWGTDSMVWCNPPYDNIMAWVDITLTRPRPSGVMLVPARTDRTWFRDCLAEHEIWFIQRRIKFDPPRGFTGKPTSSGFPVMAVIFGREAVPGRVLCVDPAADLHA